MGGDEVLSDGDAAVGRADGVVAAMAGAEDSQVLDLSDVDRGEYGPGLDNPNNACFVNATLQAFASLRVFVLEAHAMRLDCLISVACVIPVGGSAMDLRLREILAAAFSQQNKVGCECVICLFIRGGILRSFELTAIGGCMFCLC